MQDNKATKPLDNFKTKEYYVPRVGDMVAYKDSVNNIIKGKILSIKGKKAHLEIAINYGKKDDIYIDGTYIDIDKLVPLVIV